MAGASALSRLAGAAKPATKKKAEKPEILDDGLDPLIDKIISCKGAIKTAESQLADAEDQLNATVGPQRLAICRDLRRVESTIRLNGKLSFIVQNRYSKVPQEHAAAAREAFGDQASQFFRETFAVALTPEAVSDEAFVDRLVAAIGEEEFAKRFTVTRELAVTEAFHNAFTLDDRVEQVARPLIDQGIIKPAKSSCRQ